MSAPPSLPSAPFASLRGRRALVTAGAQGLGLAIVHHLLAGGAHVAIHAHTSTIDLDALRAALPFPDQRVSFHRADLRRRADAHALVDAAVTALGGLDILVNNAGSLLARRRLEQLAEDDFWRDSIDLNLASVAWVTQAAVPALAAAQGASIVNLASLAGRKGGHGGSLVYSTLKGAVLTWTRALANELGDRGIRVNAVAPGLILGTSFHATHTTQESIDQTVAALPLGRAGNPADVARAVAFFASEAHGFITGATLDLNGGAYCA